MNNPYDTSTGSYGRTPVPSSAAPDRKKRLFRWGAGITLAGFLAGGGIAWAVTTGGPAASTSATSTPAASTSATGAPTSGQAAVFNSALNTASSTSAAVPAIRVRRALARLRALGGVDGEFTFHNTTGFHTLAFERGTIQSASGGDIVVKASDGTVWTWEIVSDTVVRQGGTKTTTSALSPGETVFAGGPIVSGAKDARLIVIRKAVSSGSTGSSGSDSSQATLS